MPGAGGKTRLAFYAMPLRRRGGDDRAQAVQAQARGVPPHSDMNPALLKPNSDTGCQVIIQGRALNNMAAQAYHDYKRVARMAVMDSFSRPLDILEASCLA